MAAECACNQSSNICFLYLCPLGNYLMLLLTLSSFPHIPALFYMKYLLSPSSHPTRFPKYIQTLALQIPNKFKFALLCMLSLLWKLNDFLHPSMLEGMRHSHKYNSAGFTSMQTAVMSTSAQS